MNDRHKRLLALACYVALLIAIGGVQSGPAPAAEVSAARPAATPTPTPRRPRAATSTRLVRTPTPTPRRPRAAAPARLARTPTPTPRRPGVTAALRPTTTPSTASPTARPVTATYWGELALVGGTLIDGSGGPPLQDAVVIVRGNRIVTVGRAGEVPIPPDIPTRDLHGKTILPGFVNAHVHTDLLTDQALQGWTRAGITTVRDLAGPRDLMLQRRQKMAAGMDATYPRLVVAGPFITAPDGHPIPIDGLSDKVVTVQGPDDARAKVTALIDSGVDLVKIVVSGRTDTRWPELSNDEIQAITDTAHGRGVRVAAHVDRAAALRRAVEHGIDDAAHMPRDRMPDDLIALMVQRNVALVPTIDVYEALAEGRLRGDEWRRLTLPLMQDNLRRFAAAGGTLALADDYGGNPGVALGMPMGEIEHWLGAGLSPMQVIVAATRGSAMVCGLGAQVGMVQPGMIADLLVVEGDPLTDITALTRVALVVHNGATITP